MREAYVWKRMLQRSPEMFVGFAIGSLIAWRIYLSKHL